MDAYAQGLKLSAAGQHARAIAAFEQALAADPNDTRTLFALGNTARALGMKGPAEQFYRRVLALEPGRLEAIVNLANLLRAQGQFAAAEALLGPALARHPQTPELWLTLGSTCREAGDAGQAMEHYRKALELKPGYVAAMVNLADLLCDAGSADEALVLYDRALKSEPDNAQARLNRAILHLLLGNLKDGWRDYAARLKVPGKAPVPDHGLTRWSGDNLKRKRLLVTAEQGVGDQLMFAGVFGELCARTASDGGTLILESEPRLVDLFARSFPEMSVRPWVLESREGTVRARYDWLKSAGGANAFTEMGTLPRLFRKELSQFAEHNVFLKPDTAEQARWRTEFAGLPRPLIGICWRSGSTGGARAVQYAPLQAWADFLKSVPGTVISAQYDGAPEEVGALVAASGKLIIVPQDINQKQDLDRACALFSVFDAMVSAPTAVSWLSAGAGVPTAKVLYDTSWTSFGQVFEPLAPAARCMMPAQRGDWSDTFAQTLAWISKLPV